MSSITDMVVLQALLSQKTEKSPDPIATWKRFKKFMKEEESGKKKDDKKGISTLDMGMFFFALVPILGPVLMLMQLSYLMKIAEVLQHGHP